MSEPDAEDWGWYSSVEWKGRPYLLGSSASEEEGGEREWILRSTSTALSRRSFREREDDQDDECARYFQRLLEGEASFNAISVDPEP